MDFLAGKDSLRDFFSRGYKPREEWKVALEYEQFLIRPDQSPLPFLGEDGVEVLLKRLGETLDWPLVYEGAHVIGLKSKDGREVTLEPGAQLELGTRPEKNLLDLEKQLQEFQVVLTQLAHQQGADVLAVGAQPVAKPQDIVRIPKARYDVLEPWLMEADDLGLWMMRCTCGMQVNFDHQDAGDAARKVRMVYRLSPLFTALFANSRWAGGVDTGFASWRGHIWSRTDASRCGIVESLAQPTSNLDDYVEWMLDVPMLFTADGEGYLDRRGQSFRKRFADGRATVADWELHLSTPFPEVRLRPQVELRCADAGDLPMAMALAALVKGVFYEEQSLQQAETLVADWSMMDLQAAWHRSHRLGLADDELFQRCQGLLDLADLPADEGAYLAPLRAKLST